MPRKTSSTKIGKQAAAPRCVFNDGPTPLYLKVVIAIIVILLLAFVFFKDSQRYRANTDEVRKRIQTTLEAARLPGKELASSTVDKGCDSRVSVGLSTHINCSMEGYKYFEISGDKKSTLRSIDTALESLGLKKYDNNGYANQVLDGTREGDVEYTNKYISAQLGWSTIPGGVNGPGSTAVSEALTSHKITAHGENATVVGVVVRETYWSCSSGGLDLFGASCVFPPHSPNKR